MSICGKLLHIWNVKCSTLEESFPNWQVGYPSSGRDGASWRHVWRNQASAGKQMTFDKNGKAQLSLWNNNGHSVLFLHLCSKLCSTLTGIDVARLLPNVSLFPILNFPRFIVCNSLMHIRWSSKVVFQMCVWAENALCPLAGRPESFFLCLIPFYWEQLPCGMIKESRRVLRAGYCGDSSLALRYYRHFSVEAKCPSLVVLSNRRRVVGKSCRFVQQPMPFRNVSLSVQSFKCSLVLSVIDHFSQYFSVRSVIHHFPLYFSVRSVIHHFPQCFSVRPVIHYFPQSFSHSWGRDLAPWFRRLVHFVLTWVILRESFPSQPVTHYN